MKSSNYKLGELFILFVLFPISLVLDYAIWIKFILGILGFVYVVFILIRVEKSSLKIRKDINWKLFWQRTLVKLMLITVLTTAFVWFTDKENLFLVVRTKPLFWVFILFIYSLFSVYPQEVLYRTFFFQRYESLFADNRLFLFVNAIVFSLGHLFFKNTLVLVITFLGGLLFALTFKKTRSTFLVSLEHAIYGCWLFTVGMGEMLGFPS
ncbi:CPBP family intramembrane glutamic endopeptidase [Hanstruepera marina]|uniref:CPBP family intramembrane glutamic endopeptidase n=1 Tax=Hanstruepera marina TaxID=2873265 RepID=UPI001CA62482|nr:CPBP family intramembrane glutamic endopeptidase [Hanstruepera marina]